MSVAASPLFATIVARPLLLDFIIAKSVTYD